MNAEQRRRTSKLTAAPAGPVPTTPDRQTDSQPGAQADRDSSRAELVSFNCKLDRRLQQSVRHHAVDTGLRIQDIVDTALREYLAARDLSPGQ